MLIFLNYLAQKEFDFKIKNDENSLNNLIKYLELKSYNFPQLKKAKEGLNNILFLNSILYFYEKVQAKAFPYLTKELKEKIMKEEYYIEENILKKIETIFENNKIIKKEILNSAFRKYILRYIKKENKFLFNLSELYKSKDVWDRNTHGTKEFTEEFNNILQFDFDENNGKQCVIKYCYLNIYEIKMAERRTTVINNDPFRDDDVDLND